MRGARASVCGRSGRFCQVCAFFPRKPICRTDVGEDGSGGCFSAAAGQPHHSKGRSGRIAHLTFRRAKKILNTKESVRN